MYTYLMEDRNNELIVTAGRVVGRLSHEKFAFQTEQRCWVLEHFPFHSRRMNIAAKIASPAYSSAAA
jgi:hypothetical protein